MEKLTPEQEKEAQEKAVEIRQKFNNLLVQLASTIPDGFHGVYSLDKQNKIIAKDKPSSETVGIIYVGKALASENGKIKVETPEPEKKPEK